MSEESFLEVKVKMVLTHQPICGEDLSAHKLAVAMAHNNPGHGKEPGIYLFWLWDQRPDAMDAVQRTFFARVGTVEEFDGV